MSEDRIDAVIAEFNAAEEAAPAQEAEVETKEASLEQETVEQDAKNEEVDTAEKTDQEDSSDDAEDNEPFPKKAVKALSRRDKQIGKLRAQNEQLQQRLQALEQAQNQKQREAEYDASAPNEDNFDSYEDYLEAKLLHKLNKANQIKEPEQKQPTPEEIADYQRKLERVEKIKQQEEELLQVVPDYKEIEAAHQDLIDQAVETNPELINLFMEMDNPPLVFATLAKQGKLESLLDMPIHKAAIEIGKAMAIGLPQPKRLSNAPAPIKPLSGTGSSPSPLQMNDKQFMEWLKS